MRTITVYIESDIDCARIMKALHNTEFEDSIEVYEMDVDIDENHLESFEELLDRYHETEPSEENYQRFKKEVAGKFGIGYLEKLK